MAQRFGEAELLVVANDVALRDTLKRDEQLVTTSVGKMQTSMNGLTRSTLNTQQAFSLMGPSVSAFSGSMSAAIGPLVGVGSAIAGIGSALFSLPGLAIAAAIAIGGVVMRLMSVRSEARETAREALEIQAGLRERELGILGKEVARMRAGETRVEVLERGLRVAAGGRLIAMEEQRLEIAQEQAAVVQQIRDYERQDRGGTSWIDVQRRQIVSGLQEQVARYDAILEEMKQLTIAARAEEVRLAKDTEDKIAREKLEKVRQAEKQKTEIILAAERDRQVRIMMGMVRGPGEAVEYIAGMAAMERERRQQQALVLEALDRLERVMPFDPVMQDVARRLRSIGPGETAAGGMRSGGDIPGGAFTSTRVRVAQPSTPAAEEKKKLTAAEKSEKHLREINQRGARQELKKSGLKGP